VPGTDFSFPQAFPQEFHLSVTPLGSSQGDDHRYLLRTERYAPGVPIAEGEVVWPVERWLDQARQLMEAPLESLLWGPSSPGDRAARLTALGRELYDALFQGAIRDSWLAAQSVSQSHGAPLRLRLVLKGDRLPRLPWEALYSDGHLLTTGTGIVFSRSRYQASRGLDLEQQIRAHRRSDSLRILMAIASPDDQASLELHQEVARLRSELEERYRADGCNIVLDVLEQPDRTELTTALEQRQYQIFHYAGHSSPGADGGTLHLVSRRTGLTETLSGEDLSGLLANNGTLLAFFNSCRGSYSAAGDRPLLEDTTAVDNLAAALVKRGLPGVLAMAEQIPDDVALTLTQLFYRNLQPGYPVDLSLNRVRQGLVSAYGSDGFYWALPILYLHPAFDGLLFEPPPPTTAGGGRIPGPVAFQPAWDDRPSDDVTPSLIKPNLTPNPTPSPAANPAPPPATGQSVGDGGAIAADSGDRGGSIPANSPTKPGLGLDLLRDRLLKSSTPWVAGGLVATAVGVIGLNWPRSPGPAPLPDPGPNPIATLDPQNLDDASTAIVMELASFRFNQRDSGGGAAALETLLDRNALREAQTVVSAIPTDGLTPQVQWLRGRLAWQLLRADGANAPYGIADVVRDWTAAIAADPTNFDYRNALAFAQYRNYQLAPADLGVRRAFLDDAENQWQEALKLLQAQAPANPVPLAGADPIADRAAIAELNALAGLALVQWARSKDNPDRAIEYRNAAIAYRQRVATQGETTLTAQVNGQSGGQSWLWTESAAIAWREIPANPEPLK
jgi:hypothetical protein